MRLVHLTASPFFGGPERQMLGLARALPAGLRHDLRLLRRRAATASRFWPRPAPPASTPAGCGTTRRTCSRPRANSPSLLRELSADVLLCHGYKANLVGRPAARPAGVPAVAVVRGWTGQDFRVRCYERLDRVLLKRMDHVVCVSDGQAAARCPPPACRGRGSGSSATPPGPTPSATRARLPPQAGSAVPDAGRAAS